jgi:hypothetical protein
MEAVSAAACAIGAFIGFHGQTRIIKKLGLDLSQDLTIIGNLNSNITLKIWFYLESRMVYGLCTINKIRGCHIHFLSSKSAIEKRYDGSAVKPYCSQFSHPEYRADSNLAMVELQTIIVRQNCFQL